MQMLNTNGYRMWAIAKRNHVHAHNANASLYTNQAQRSDITGNERSWLLEQAAKHNEIATQFPEFHPGEW